MIKRETYLDRIRPFIGKPVIKAITGIRRCGKSTLLKQIIDELKENSIPASQIIYIDKELISYDFIKNYLDLHHYINENTPSRKKKTYIFIDEVQEIEKWEKTVNSLLAEKNYDIFITGSNAHLLSSELATLISGRYIEFCMFTFSYKEFVEIARSKKIFKSSEESFYAFLKYGGFPGIFGMDWSENNIMQYLQAVYTTVLLKDIIVRYQIRDAAMLERIMKFIAGNAGNITTAKNISDYVKSQHRNVSVETVQNYIRYAVNALMVQQVQRFDIRGKRILETHEKYFLCDLGLNSISTPFTAAVLPGHLENAVLLELLIRGYRVNIGKVYDREIDFIAQKNNDKIYIQVCTSLNDSKVIAREYGALEAVKDHFPKLVLSLDHGFDASHKGIRWMNVKDFLMGNMES